MHVSELFRGISECIQALIVTLGTISGAYLIQQVSGGAAW